MEDTVKQQITEEQKVHLQWYEDAKKQTLETLPAFLNHIMEDYQHDYGTICHAITAGGIATMWALNNHKQGGITGFQAGAVMWEFIRNWQKTSNKTGLRLVDYDNMLYPQYKEQFEKTISEGTWSALQAEAKSNMAETENIDHVHPNVYDHWSSIASGKIPFGYRVTKD